MNRVVRAGATTLALGLGLIWAFAALSKSADLLLPLTRSGPTWVDQFPRPLIICAIVIELATAGLLIAGQRFGGLAMGAFLLAAFTALLVAFPIKEGQTCGCLGAMVSGTLIDAVDPLLRNAFLGSAHVLALALGSRRKPQRGAETNAATLV